MLRRLVRRLTAVSARLSILLWLQFQSCLLISFTDGYGHLILRVEFAKRAT